MEIIVPIKQSVSKNYSNFTVHNKNYKHEQRYSKILQQF